jgi:hypothetical protein
MFLVLALAALIAAGCGGQGSVKLDRRLDADCGQHGLEPAPLAQEQGVYRAGALTLAVGEDLAQTSTGSAGGSEAIAVVTGGRSVTATVEPGTPATVAFQFGAPLNARAAAGGDLRVRFPACGGRVRRFFGGILFTGAGCARVRVTEPGAPAAQMLIPIANRLSGCPTHPGPRLPASALPFLGVACGRPDWIGCQRLGIAATVNPSATMVVVRVAGRLVTLSPPDPGATAWLGYLDTADYHHGPLAIPIPITSTHWVGTPVVWPHTALTTFSPTGETATITGQVLMHPGFG